MGLNDNGKNCKYIYFLVKLLPKIFISQQLKAYACNTVRIFELSDIVYSFLLEESRFETLPHVCNYQKNN